MRNFFFPIALAIITGGIYSCSSDKTDDNNADKKSDTLNTAAVIEKKSIQTDSGRIDIEFVQGNAEGKAVLVDADGKIIGRGMMRGDIPVGAWMKYDNNGNLISAEHYSNGKLLQQLDVTDFQFREFSNEKMGVKFNVPNKWKENSSPNQALIVTFEKQVKDDSIHIKPNFSVVKAKLQKGETIQSLAKMQLDLMHENYNRVQVIQENNIVVDSCFAIQRYGYYDNGNARAGFLNVMVLCNNDVWIISCEAQNNKQGEFLKYQGVFQEIVESFKRLK